MRFYGVLLTFFLSGCYAAELEPALTMPSATLIFKKGYDKRVLFAGASQSYLSASSHTCKGLKKYALFNWSDGEEKVRRVAAGTKVTIQGEIAQTTSANAAGTAGTICSQSASFTPQNGMSYVIIQRDISFGRCPIQITNKMSDEQVVDYMIEQPLDCD